ncbi:MAG TPA: cation:dicarboxylase symporter family transporter [Terriglobales bacterium]|nr:cation:dicarboxylase symporter family transporter [Terriglobales bacterium]
MALYSGTQNGTVTSSHVLPCRVTLPGSIPFLAVTFLFPVRWLAVLALGAYAFYRRTLTTWILAGMVLGAAIGYDFPGLGVNLRLLAQIFLRLIKVIIAPLLFATLVSGIASHSDLKKVGRMGIKALVYFEIVTTLALFIGLAAINLSQAGVGAQIPTAKTETVAAEKLSAGDTILHVFPENIAKSIAENQVLQVVVFSLLFGIALSLVKKEEKRRPMLAFTESLSEVMFKFTNIVMLFAPLGVLGAIAYTVASTGVGILGNLAKLLLTLYVALAAFVTLVLLPIALAFKVPLRRFLRAVAEPASIAFGTANSEAALPRAMESMEALGAPREIVSFIMPMGYSFNLDGSTLYLSLASIFVAQAAGLHLSFGHQLYIMLVLMLTSKGVAGVSRASLVILLATAGTVGLPTEPIFILLGVDQLLDMGRTAVNVIGNCLATVVIAKWEGEFGGAPASQAVLEGAGKEVSS